MAKRRGHDGRRDKYGRYKAKSGGIKAYKSNLPTMKAGNKRKKPGPVKATVKGPPNKKTGGWSAKKRVVVGAVAGYAAFKVIDKTKPGDAVTRFRNRGVTPTQPFVRGTFESNRDISRNTYIDTSGNRLRTNHLGGVYTQNHAARAIARGRRG